MQAYRQRNAQNVKTQAGSINLPKQRLCDIKILLNKFRYDRVDGLGDLYVELL